MSDSSLLDDLTFDVAEVFFESLTDNEKEKFWKKPDINRFLFYLSEIQNNTNQSRHTGIEKLLKQSRHTEIEKLSSLSILAKKYYSKKNIELAMMAMFLAGKLAGNIESIPAPAFKQQVENTGKILESYINYMESHDKAKQKRVNARHKSSRALKKKAIDLYYSSTWNSKLSASKKIATHLHDWAIQQNLTPLKESNAQQTVYKWLIETKG